MEWPGDRWPHETEFASLGRGRTEPPNVIFILADDLGWADLGCYGSTAISTPNLDRLASQGVRFTHAYSASPWCSPTRVGLYTGRYPGRLEVGLDEPLQIHHDRNGIPADHPTIASMLVDAGYETAMFGKWHCGWLPWFSPLRIGFQTFFGNLDGAVDYFEHIDTLGKPDLYEGETPVEMVGYYTDLLSERAAEFVAADRDRPFYLQLNYTAPHWPWEGRDDAAVGAEIRRRYEAGEGAYPIMHFDGGSLAKYGEMVEAMDDGIGQVIAALESAGRRDNTLIVFCSDNGGERWSKNWPFVGEKGDITEGGIRVPFIMRWPEAVAAGQVSDQPNITMDWTATILEAAGVGIDDLEPSLDGVSLLPWLVDGAPHPEHDLYWRIASQSAMRRGKYKFVHNLRPSGTFGSWPLDPRPTRRLYDVTVDGREAANIRRLHRDIADEMQADLDRLNAELLPYPPDHRCLPQQATATEPAISQPD